MGAPAHACLSVPQTVRPTLFERMQRVSAQIAEVFTPDAVEEGQRN